MRTTQKIAIAAIPALLFACAILLKPISDDELRSKAIMTDGAAYVTACAPALLSGDPCFYPDGGSVGAPGIGDSGLVCNITSYGAISDAGNMTDAIQAAINACDGGTVVVPAGLYQAGTLTLHSNMVLAINDGGTLQGVVPANLDASASLYPVPTPFPTPNNSNSPPMEQAFVYANGATNLTIQGPGVIDGNGGAPIWSPTGGTLDYNRPIDVWITNSKNVTLSNVSIINSALWTLVLAQDTGVLVDTVTISSPNASERDGLDIVDSQNVCVSTVNVTSEDDGIVLKSGSLIGIDSVHVRNATVTGAPSFGNGIKTGTTSYGNFTNLCFENANVTNYAEAAIAVESVDGAYVANVLFSGITLSNVEAPFFVLFGDRYVLPEGGVKKVGAMSCLTFENIDGGNITQPWGSAISGTAVPDAGILEIHNVTFSNVTLSLLSGNQAPRLRVVPNEYSGQYPRPNVFGQLPGWAFFTRHADSVTFENMTLSISAPDSRLPYYLDPPP